MSDAVAYHFVHRNLYAVVAGDLFSEPLKCVPVSNADLTQAAALFTSIIGRWFHKVHQDAGIKPIGHAAVHLLRQDYPWGHAKWPVDCRRTLCCIVFSFAIPRLEE